jgi:hypothetical protein
LLGELEQDADDARVRAERGPVPPRKFVSLPCSTPDADAENFADGTSPGFEIRMMTPFGDATLRGGPHSTMTVLLP